MNVFLVKFSFKNTNTLNSFSILKMVLQQIVRRKSKKTVDNVQVPDGIKDSLI